MKPLIKRLVTLMAAVALPATLLTGPIASPAQAGEPAPIDTYPLKVEGLTQLQESGGGSNQFSLSVAPQVGWDAGLEGLRPPAASMYRLWDMQVAWKDVNPAQGVFTWSELDRRVALVESWGGKPLLVLGLTPQWAAVDPDAGDERWGAGTASPPKDIAYWNDYVNAVVTKYGSRIAGYELWNEANLTTFWRGSTKELYDMAVSASSIIKAANPAAVVLSPSTTTRLRASAREFTAGFASQIPEGEKGPFDAWTIHSYPTGSAGVNFETEPNTKSPRAAADKRVDDILSWQNALVDAVGSDSPALKIDIYDTEVNYGLKGPGIEPGQNWSADEATQLMNMTYQDSQNLGINATFWYQYTATPYDLLGVQWNPSDPGLNNMWDTMRSVGVPAIAEPSFRASGSGYAVPSFKNCFIRNGSDCSGQKLKGIDLSGMPMLTIDFSDSFLGNANLYDANLSRINFNNAYLGNADLRKTFILKDGPGNMQARSFYKADFRDAVLQNVEVKSAQFYGSKWDEATLIDVELSDSDFRTANFSSASFFGKNNMTRNVLTNTIWNSAKISKQTDFSGSGNCPKALGQKCN